MCAYPLIEDEATSQELLPIELDIDGKNDAQLVANIEETANMTENDGQAQDLIPSLVKTDDLTPSIVQPDDLTPLVQPALDLNRNLQTNFNVQNWNGGTVNTGLTIGTAYFISDVHCSGTQCSVFRLT